MKWNIRDLEIKNQVVVAPMAGVTNMAFRMLLKEYGAGLIYSEMISDKGLLYENNRTQGMVDVNNFEKPIALQLFGSEVDTMIKAAIFIDKETDSDVIDINMGCPVNKVVKSGAGSKMMTTPDLAYKIVKSIVDNVKKPVTVKIRSGWDHRHINAVEFAKRMEMAGVSAIAVHGRTRTDMYSGVADLDIIKQVKANVSIPVIGNGDIRTPEEAKYMLDYTDCDAIMIGRGLLGNPFLVKQIVDFLDSGKYRENPSLEELKSAIFDHMNKLIDLKGDYVAALEMRSHAAWYIKGLPGSAKVRTKIVNAKSPQEIRNTIDEYFRSI